MTAIGALNCAFFIGHTEFFWYSMLMLSGIKLFTSDPCWAQILAELGATLVDDARVADANFDTLNLSLPVSTMELKTAIIVAMDNTKILDKIFGRRVSLSPAQENIVARLYKNGGMTAGELRAALGYAPDATTHTVETAIYGLRRLFGRDFIKNQDGKFIIGGI